MNKIRQYFSTLELTRGFFIALLSSSFIYLSHWGFSIPILNTFLALLSLHLLLESNTKTWFISGSFIAFFWFWWISLSLIHYQMLWAVPIELLIIIFSYGLLFMFISWFSMTLSKLLTLEGSLFTLSFKALMLLTLSYVHPFSFDWYKPELMFVESYIGIEKWQFALILLAMVLSIWRKQLLYLLLIMFAYQPYTTSHAEIPQTMALTTTHTTVKDKWNTDLHAQQFDALLQTIDNAIAEEKHLIVLPESVFPIFLNHSEALLSILSEKAKHIAIIVGGLYHDGETPHNSTYIFSKGKIAIANKVLLVPFGESNPLPDFLSDWVNEIFYDGSVDYQASNTVVDYEIDGITYRNAICFEATSEKLYEKNKAGQYPKNMIVLSNNGWFTPSIEPTLQKLLLLYYHKKYGTTIYHSINMSESYIIQ
jgi:apolipoprotein N-acyltransferase